MSDPDQRGNNKVLVVRIFLILDMAFCFYQGVLGVRDLVSPPTNACGRANPNAGDALIVIAAVLPVMALGIRLLIKPTHVRYQTILAFAAIVALTLLALVVPVGYRFQNSFCLSPF